MIFGTPTIVTNGLILHLDAGNRMSYAGSGRVWRDLSGNGYDNSSTQALNTLPSYNTTSQGYFTFNGTSQYVSSSYNQPAYTSATSFTWNVWVNPATVATAAPILGNRGGAELVFTKLTPQSFQYYSSTLNANLATNVWQNVCVVKNGSSFTEYINGYSVGQFTNATSKVATPFHIGGDPIAGEYFAGSISNVQVYNRALTNQEVIQNYNAIKSRYGLI